MDIEDYKEDQTFMNEDGHIYTLHKVTRSGYVHFKDKHGNIESISHANIINSKLDSGTLKPYWRTDNPKNIRP